MYLDIGNGVQSKTIQWIWASEVTCAPLMPEGHGSSPVAVEVNYLLQLTELVFLSPTTIMCESDIVFTMCKRLRNVHILEIFYKWVLNWRRVLACCLGFDRKCLYNALWTIKFAE